MKKCLFAVFALMLIFPVFAGEGDMHLGPNLGIVLPVGDPADYYSVSPGLGVRFLYGINNQMTIEGNIDYVLLQPNSDFDDSWDGITMSNLAICAALRYTTNGKFYFGGGLSYNTFTFEYDSPYYGKIHASESEIGIFGLAGMIFEKKSFDIDPQARLSLIDGDIWISAGVGLNFPLGGKK
jgi:hypothetical protein